MKLVKWVEAEGVSNGYHLWVVSADKMEHKYPEIRAFHVVMKDVSATKLSYEKLNEEAGVQVAKGYHAYKLDALITDTELYPFERIRRLVEGTSSYNPMFGVEDYLDASLLKNIFPGMCAQFELWVQDMRTNIQAIADRREVKVEIVRAGYDLYVNEQKFRMLDLYRFFALHQMVVMNFVEGKLQFIPQQEAVMSVEEWCSKMRVRLCQHLAGAKVTDVIPFGYFRYGDAQATQSLFICITADGRENMIGIPRAEADFLITYGKFPRVGILNSEATGVSLSIEWTHLLPKDYGRWQTAAGMFNLELMALHDVV